MAASKYTAKAGVTSGIRVARDAHPLSAPVQKALTKQLKSATRATNKLKAKRTRATPAGR